MRDAVTNFPVPENKRLHDVSNKGSTMKRSHPERIPGLVVERDQAVIAIPLIENGRDVVHYVVETGTSTPAYLPGSVRDALDLAGVWSDLDWDETVEALERIRQESQPTPPIDSTEL